MISAFIMGMIILCVKTLRFVDCGAFGFNCVDTRVFQISQPEVFKKRAQYVDHVTNSIVRKGSLLRCPANTICNENYPFICVGIHDFLKDFQFNDDDVIKFDLDDEVSLTEEHKEETDNKLTYNLDRENNPKGNTLLDIDKETKQINDSFTNVSEIDNSNKSEEKQLSPVTERGPINIVIDSGSKINLYSGPMNGSAMSAMSPPCNNSFIDKSKSHNFEKHDSSLIDTNFINSKISKIFYDFSDPLSQALGTLSKNDNPLARYNELFRFSKLGNELKRNVLLLSNGTTEQNKLAYPENSDRIIKDRTAGFYNNFHENFGVGFNKSNEYKYLEKDHLEGNTSNFKNGPQRILKVWYKLHPFQAALHSFRTRSSKGTCKVPGYFPSRTDCSVYYLCKLSADGHTILGERHSCPVMGEIFDQSKKLCRQEQDISRKELAKYKCYLYSREKCDQSVGAHFRDTNDDGMKHLLTINEPDAPGVVATPCPCEETAPTCKSTTVPTTSTETCPTTEEDTCSVDDWTPPVTTVLVTTTSTCECTTTTTTTTTLCPTEETYTTPTESTPTTTVTECSEEPETTTTTTCTCPTTTVTTTETTTDIQIEINCDTEATTCEELPSTTTPTTSTCATTTECLIPNENFLKKDKPPQGEKFRCQMPGTFRDPNDPSIFYICIKKRNTENFTEFYEFTMQCGHGKIFNSSMKKCCFPSETFEY